MSAIVPPSCIVETPASLAHALVQAIRLPNAKWLDPCVGDGVFPRAVVQQCGGSTILGVDCRRIEQIATVCEFLQADFLSIDRDRAEADVIVANPPYVPVGRLSDDLRETALRARHLDLTVAGSSSYWLPFLLHSLGLLNEGGNIGFILPASFEYADYAKDARAQIPKLFRRFVVHRSLTPLFPSVSDGCIVVLGFGFSKQHAAEHRYEHQDLASLLKALKGKPKANGLINSSSAQTSRLGDVVKIGIGAVTGDSKYFLMSDSTRQHWKIDEGDCLPVLTRSEQVRKNLLEVVTKLECAESGRHWLFRPREKDIRSDGASAYLKHGIDGACARGNFKVKNRKRWYWTPDPVSPDGALTGMFSEVPSVCLLGEGMSLTNTLYWFRAESLKTVEDKRALALSLYCSESLDAIRRTVRRYPDGLLKLEPSQFANLPYCEIDARQVSDALLGSVKFMIEKGDFAECSKVVDSIRT